VGNRKSKLGRGLLDLGRLVSPHLTHRKTPIAFPMEKQDVALKICPDCDGKVSDKAKSCPHCGCPTTGDAEQTPENSRSSDEEFWRRLDARANRAKSERDAAQAYLDAGIDYSDCLDCLATNSIRDLIRKPQCIMCGRPMKFKGKPKPANPLVTCSGCDQGISSAARHCPHCGPGGVLESTPPEDGSASSVSDPVPVEIPAGSVGACPACGSYQTFDKITEERNSRGFWAAKGMKAGLRFSGRGRCQCNSCGHNWEFNLP